MDLEEIKLNHCTYYSLNEKESLIRPFNYPKNPLIFLILVQTYFSNNLSFGTTFTLFPCFSLFFLSSFFLSSMLLSLPLTLAAPELIGTASTKSCLFVFISALAFIPGRKINFLGLLGSMRSL